MILDLLKFVLSGPFKFAGFMIILLIIAVVIEEAIVNICKTIIYIKKIKYNNILKEDDIDID